MHSKKNIHRKNALNTGLKFIYIKKFSVAKNTNFNKCFSQKFSNQIKNNIFGEDEPVQSNDSIKKENNSSKLNEIIDNLSVVYKDKVLKELTISKDSQEISKLAGTFMMELEVFFSTNEKV